ncbi:MULTISPECIES: sporulation protein YabP [unclassified Sporolactobacillus]|uniref:sporulation protein YabP n=1 Tax=unclassified Sporolactobacillus TaxID=2628533 RepID=UPI00236786FD|nr:sporulation protein YabP [Sporolactobacillus sp. CQH2019]MDD9150700.1 sporulation protein YabP [Sporolactobacillus sp. CQH2019]
MSQYYTSVPNKDKPAQNHDIVIKNRRTIEITGVKHVESFDHEEFLLETVMGYLAIKGAQLKMQNLNVEQGSVAIEGKIFEISYLDDQDGEPSKGFFSKLFK